MSRQSSVLQSTTIEPHGTEVIENILAARRPSWALAMPASPEPEARPTPSSLSISRGPSHRPSTPEVSHRSLKPQPEAEQSDSVALDSPEEGKSFRSSWEINVKKLVGDAVGNVNLICHVKRSGKLTNATSLDEYKSHLARYRSCSVCSDFCSSFLCSINKFDRRRGLFIIDLESRFSIPRFLPQGGTWEVADVQWNPHPSHAQYIVSTSAEKLFVLFLYW